ncbi:hypothetical protein AB5J49_43985 [Streptomyces sp. R28]|uniref:Uncharacterized protein n=1 Tax=Streptomyces sp. R28 TaxID=3238628 RepID=A0AB39QA16_9ACTN
MRDGVRGQARIGGQHDAARRGGVVARVFLLPVSERAEEVAAAVTGALDQQQLGAGVFFSTEANGMRWLTSAR